MKTIIFLTLGIWERNQCENLQSPSHIKRFGFITAYKLAILHAMSFKADDVDFKKALAQLYSAKPNNTDYGTEPDIADVFRPMDEQDFHNLISRGMHLNQNHTAYNNILMQELGMDKSVFDQIISTSSTAMHQQENKDVNMPNPARSPEWNADQQEARAIARSLSQFFYGQKQTTDDLINGISRQSLRTSKLGLKQSYFMIGPSGTGKTHLAAQLSRFYKEKAGFDSYTFDMARISSENQEFDLIGLTAGYAEAQPGNLTKFISEHPKGCIVIFDNIHSCHPKIQSVLIEAFDTGFLTDKYQPDSNKTDMPEAIKVNPVDCSNTIFIFTTNAASDFMTGPKFRRLYQDSPDAAKRTVLDKLSKLQKPDKSRGLVSSFQHDLFSRLTANTVLLFPPLLFPDLMQIAEHKYLASKSNLEKSAGITISESNINLMLRSGIFKIGNELNALRVASDTFGNTFLDEAIKAIDTDSSITEIRLDVGQEFAAQINDGLQGVCESTLAHELFRKGKYLDFEVRLSKDGSLLTIIFENALWKKATRSEDADDGGFLTMEIPDIRFDDIKGHRYAKEKLQEIVKLLKHPEKLGPFDIEPPRGLLLYGEPGTGKTMLAKALANEAGLPFLSCTGPELLQNDASSSRLQEIYKSARHYAPSIVFIDEIDILGNRASEGYKFTINQLLAEIDGFSSTDEHVFTVAATNYPERLDPAILRSGRIDLKIHVPRLDKEARKHFLEKIKALPAGTNLDIDALLDDTAGMTGAEMEQVQRSIGMHLIRHGGTEITTKLAEDIIAIIRYGEISGNPRDLANRRRVAVHEAGHAIVAMALKPSRIIERITITSRGNAAGFVKFDEDQHLLITPGHVLNEMAIGLAGRSAQIMCNPDTGLDEGASSDLQSVTKYAFHACATWGFDEEIGWVSLPSSIEELAYTGMQSKLNERISIWVAKAKMLAADVLIKNRALHSELVELLLKDETLMPEEFESIKLRVTYEST